MTKLPVITAIGGYGPAGRTSSHHAFRRMIYESLPSEQKVEVILSLAVMMKILTFKEGKYIDARNNVHFAQHAANIFEQEVLDGTLIRKFDSTYQASYDPEELDEESIIYNDVQGAGQLPTGFTPESYYASRYHPRALQMAIMGASDAINSLGIPWETMRSSVAPDQIGVYASNIMGQLDTNGFGGMLQSRLKGKRVTAKQCPLGLNSMCADFVNAYVLGNIGQTSASTGACATFLYNLNSAVEDIKSGKIRVAVVGSSEAPITPEIVEGYNAMGALATNKKLSAIEKNDADWRKSSRPFGESCGFVISESSQYIVLMDDALAIELGAEIYGSVTDVYINADGFKKSIAAPGPGNYITMAKAVNSAIAMTGLNVVQNHSFIQAHGSSTPLNCITESEIFHKVAEAYSITDWPVSAVKSYLGHSLGPASADQLVSCLGTFRYNILPGIKSVDEVNTNINSSRLHICLKDQDFGDKAPHVAFINSKGFGGNNATTVIYSPELTLSWLQNRHGMDKIREYQIKKEDVISNIDDYDKSASIGSFQVIYNFDGSSKYSGDVEISAEEMSIPGFNEPLRFNYTNLYNDFFS